MKIPLGTDGSYLEHDEGPRDSKYHMRIMMIKNIPNTKSGHHLRLECGHEVNTFGDLSICGGVVLCVKCRDRDEEG